MLIMKTCCYFAPPARTGRQFTATIGPLGGRVRIFKCGEASHRRDVEQSDDQSIWVGNLAGAAT